LPEAEDYLVRRRRKEQEEQETRQHAADWTWEMYEDVLSRDHVAVARELFRRIERYVAERDLPWTAIFREGWFGFQRPGQYYVPVVNLRREKPLTFAVKVQDDPAKLGLEDPYPDLTSRWNRRHRQWTWEIPGVDQVPDLSTALDLALPYQPQRGPMAPPAP
jgi:hypothetical protein